MVHENFLNLLNIVYSYTYMIFMFQCHLKTKTLSSRNSSLAHWIVSNVFSGQEKSDLMEVSISRAE